MSREPFQLYPEKKPAKFIKRRELKNLLDNAVFSKREIVTNTIIKSARNSEAILDWLDKSSSGKTYGHIPLDLRPMVSEQMEAGMGQAHHRGWISDGNGAIGSP